MKHRNNISESRLLLRTLLTVLLFIVIRGISARYLLEYLDSRSPAVIIAADLLFLSILGLLFLYRDAKAYLASAASLREDEELFTAFIRHSPIFTYIKEVTPDHSIVLRCSDNFEVMTCVKAEEMIGKTMEEIFPPEFAAKFTADDQNVVARGSILRLQEELNGRTYLTMKYPITIGERSLLAGYTIDITDYKLAEEKLKESEEKYRALVEWSPDAIAIHVKGTTVFVNNACLTLMRAEDKESLIGRAVIEFVHPDCRDLVIERMKQSVQEGKVLPIVQEQFIRSDGTTVDVEVKSIPISFDKQPAVQLIIRDITERKRAEAELEEAEKKYRGLSEAAFESIFISEGGICLEQNAMAERMFGYTSAEAIGRPLTDWIIPEHRDLVKERMQTRTEQPYESTALRKDGTTFPCTLHGKMMNFRGREVRVSSLRDNSERAKVLSSLRESERMLTASQEASHIGSFAFNINANTWTGSEILARMFGIPKKEEQSIEEWLSVIHPEDSEELLRHFTEDVIGRGQRFSLEYRIVHRQTGAVRWVMGIGELERDEFERPVRLIGTVQDISERKAAEAALRESEQKYRSLVENVDTGIVAHAPDTHIIFCNDTASEILGLTRDQMLGKTAVDSAWHFIRENGEQLPIADYPVNRAMSQEGFDGSHILGVIVPGREGPTWVQCSAHRTVDHTGTISQVVVTFFDITFRKNAEASLQASELRFKKLLQDVQSVAVQGYAPDGTIQYWNKASERLYGYTEEEAIGKNLLDLLIPEESKEIVRQNMAAMAESGEPIRSSELSLLRKDGTRVSVFSSHTIVRIPGRTQELFCIDIDLTERKIAEESLRHSQKLESIGTLAGGIAHDFNNLLVAILGQSSLGLSKLPKESPAAENIAKAIKASERAATLTRQLLAYSGRGKFFPSVIDLNALVNENAQMLELSIPKNAQVRYELGTPDIMIKADAGQIQQLIMNLMINAGEAIGQQHGSIALRTDRLMLAPHDIHRWMIGSSPLNEGKYALLQVTDTGCGIKEDSLPKIFDPFFSTKFTGRGLGLAAVLGIIHGHGGGIHIESEEGKGTVFEVILPLVEERKNVPMHTPPEKKTFDGTGRTILVIDDELAVIELLHDILTDIHCTVIGMNDPQEAIEYFRAHGTEIVMVILDYSMPKMNGKEVFEQLVSINKSVKVLLCSGYSEDETFSLFTQHRPEGFFQKPYSRDALLQRMTEMLSIPSGRTSP